VHCAGAWDGGAVKDGEGAGGCAMGGRLVRRGGGGPSVLWVWEERFGM
jgi:hypothetical protein